MRFQRILITTDFSACAEAALELAAESCMTDGSKITLLNVCNSYTASADAKAVPFPPLPALLSDHREACRAAALNRLQQIARERFPEQEVRCAVVYPTSSVGEEISAFAKQDSADLIIMGSRGHTRLSSLIIASTVQRVLLTADCPVLVVRPKK